MWSCLGLCKLSWSVPLSLCVSVCASGGPTICVGVCVCVGVGVCV